MSFLFPLYVLGALAIAAPIAFHFLQRQPHGRQEFSSLMFLRPTPPKLTRRSRLSDLLLLLLRGLALLLLALAFTRPFLRSTTLLNLDAPSRSVCVIVDTSASMRRDTLWQQVEKEFEGVVDELEATDQVSLIAYDREPTTLMSFEAWQDAEPARRLPLLRAQLEGLTPSWYGSSLSAAMIAASDALLQQRLTKDLSQPLQIVLISDLQQGSDLEALQAYEWPEEISVDLKVVQVNKPTNASMMALPAVPSDMDASQIRVLVRNAADSEGAQFQLAWNGDQALPPIDVHVPPGHTRVVRVTQPRGGQHLRLLNDDAAFDNDLYLTETTPQQKQLWYIGDDDPRDQQSLYYYLRQASLDSRTCEVAIQKIDDLTSLVTATPKQTPFMVLSDPLRDASRAELIRFVKDGGRLLFVVQSNSAADETSEFLAALLDIPDVQLAPTGEHDYAMVAKIDFENALFKPFDDPRFSDFSKIRFWSHQQLSSSHESAWDVVVRFDDGFPALVQKQVGQGTVWVLTSGWQPKESQLALSSKFVPLLHGMFGQTAAADVQGASYAVGQPIPLTVGEPKTILDPVGTPHDIESEVESFTAADLPGIYQVTRGSEEYALAVNLPSAESRTAPMLPDRLEQLSVRLGEARSIESLKKEQRQMRNKELEDRQKLWRWGILAALCAIALETGLSKGRGADPTKENRG